MLEIYLSPPSPPTEGWGQLSRVGSIAANSTLAAGAAQAVKHQHTMGKSHCRMEKMGKRCPGCFSPAPVKWQPQKGSPQGQRRCFGAPSPTHARRTGHIPWGAAHTPCCT